MFVKVTRSGSRQYVQFVEAYRDPAGRSKQRTLFTLGRLDQLGTELNSVISGLMRITGKSPPAPAPIPAPESAPVPTVSFAAARDYGDVWTLTQLWNSLGFAELRKVFWRTRHSIDVEALLRVMVFNRLCDPESKLGVLRWLDTVTFPDISTRNIQHHQLLRAMDALVDHQGAIDSILSGLLRPLVDQDLAVVFYDMTTIRAEGLSQQLEDVRHFGMSKEGIVARQVMLGVVQTAEGLPLYHQVFDGNTAEVTTLKPVIEKIIKQFPVKRVIAVADRGLLSTDNLAELQAIQLPCGAALEFILAVPGRRYAEFDDLLSPIHSSQCQNAKEEVFTQTTWNQLRLVLAHDPEAALLASSKRDNLRSELFSYTMDERALAHARLMDGKLLLVTNVADLTPQEVVKRYKSLADIERGFRVLKSELEIGPMYHRLPDRIRAHAAICFMALILYRVMRSRLHASDTELSPERALSKLRRIQHQQVKINDTAPIAGLSTIDQEQSKILSALTIKKPTLNPQLNLL